MAWLEKVQIHNITNKLYDGTEYFDDDGIKIITDEVKEINKFYKLNKSERIIKSVPASVLDDETNSGWDFEKWTHKETRATVSKPKPSSVKFENEVWCMFYELGIRYLNYDSKFELPFEKNATGKKQIDVVAIDTQNKIVFLVECKASEKSSASGVKQTKSFKAEIEALTSMQQGFRESVYAVFGREYKVKLIFATKGYRFEVGNEDSKRLKSKNIFHLSDNKYGYLLNIITNYSTSAKFQFLGHVLKGEKISNEKIKVPALKGKMGKHDYYMFSLEPSYLLKIGYVLHRVRANEEEKPTYQRMLVKSRLKQIGNFLDEEGHFFPNSVIINFNQKETVKIDFEVGEGSSKTGSKSDFGVVKIPMAFAIANIIDGQHRIYGYSASKFFEKDTIPVVAFVDLETSEQLEMFININQNQKAIHPDLIDTLQENLGWESDDLDSRMKALKSSITRTLAETDGYVLNGLITQGGDTAALGRKAFQKSYQLSGLVPRATKRKFKKTPIDTTRSCLYDVYDQGVDSGIPMDKARLRIAEFINGCYEIINRSAPILFDKPSSENFIISNRGTYAFIMIIGNLNYYLTTNNKVDFQTNNKDRLKKIETYLAVLADELVNIDQGLSAKLFSQLGQKAESLWFHTFQDLISQRLPEYIPEELIDWRERQDIELQNKGSELMTMIGKRMKEVILMNLKLLFGEEVVHKGTGRQAWEMKLEKEKAKCVTRMEDQIQKEFESDTEERDYHWTDFFQVSEYSSILDRYWDDKPEDSEIIYETFKDLLTVDLGGHKGDIKIKHSDRKYEVLAKAKFEKEWLDGISNNTYPKESHWAENNRAKRWDRKWVDKIIPLRNLIKHDDAKQKKVTVNSKEVALLDKIYSTIKG